MQRLALPPEITVTTNLRPFLTTRTARPPTARSAARLALDAPATRIIGARGATNPKPPRFLNARRVRLRTARLVLNPPATSMRGNLAVASAVASSVMRSRTEGCVMDATGAANAKAPAVHVPIIRQINVTSCFFNLLTSRIPGFEPDLALLHMNT